MSIVYCLLSTIYCQLYTVYCEKLVWSGLTRQFCSCLENLCVQRTMDKHPPEYSAFKISFVGHGGQGKSGDLQLQTPRSKNTSISSALSVQCRPSRCGRVKERGAGLKLVKRRVVSGFFSCLIHLIEREYKPTGIL